MVIIYYFNYYYYTFITTQNMCESMNLYIVLIYSVQDALDFMQIEAKLVASARYKEV